MALPEHSRKAKVAFNDLPVELVGAIVHEVAPIRDLLRLRAVNHTFSAYATPRAFHTFHVVNTEKSARGHRLLAKSPLAPLVKKLVVHCEAGPGENKLLNTVEEDEESKAIRIAFAYNFVRLSLFPSLRDLELNFFSGMVWQTVQSAEDGTITLSHPSKYFMLQSSIMQALLGSSPRRIPRLRSLALNNIIPFPAPEYEGEALQTLMSGLEHFTMTAHALRFKGRRGEDMWSWFWSEMVPERFLAPAQRTLRSLTLFSDQPIGQFPTVDLSWLRFPQLASLRLAGFTFNEHTLAEDFVVAHGATLRSLTLDTCPMHVDCKEPPRPWAVVYQRFAERLTALVEFSTLRRTGWGLHEKDTRLELQSPYERSITGYGYERGKDVKLPLSVVQADRIALRNFLRTVNRRREARSMPPLALPALSVVPLMSRS